MHVLNRAGVRTLHFFSENEVPLRIRNIFISESMEELCKVSFYTKHRNDKKLGTHIK